MFPLLKDPILADLLLEIILETPGGRRSVSRLARTCKGLSDPALKALWRELDSLVPLLALLPNNLFKRPRRPGLGFVRSPEASDWKKVLAYGELVSKITYNEAAGNIHPSIFSVLEECKAREFLLPNLKTLVWKVESSEGLERGLLFLNPGLKDLIVEIGSGIPQDEMLQFLKEVASQTRLTGLSITSPTRIPQSLPRLMQEHIGLENVSLMAPGALTTTIGRWLSSLPSLKSFEIDVGDRSDGHIASFFGKSSSNGMVSPDSILTPESRGMSDDEFSGTGSLVFVNLPSVGTGFKQLIHLAVAGEVPSVSNFLSRIPSRLRSVELALDEPDSSKEWELLWSTLSRHFKQSLTSICVSASGTSKFTEMIRSTARGENSARRLSLKPLESLPFLTRFEIDMPESRVFLDADLEHLALSCPNLESVKLCPLSRWPLPYGPPKATLAGLAPLTARCKHLQSLSMPINAIGTSDDSLFDLETSSQSLIRMHVGHAWVDDPLHVSILLSHLAPHLEGLKWFHEKNRPGYVEAHNVGWQRVSEILPQLQRLRLHERANARALSTVPGNALSLLVLDEQPARPPPTPPPEPVIDLPVIVYEEKAVQIQPHSIDFGVQARPATRHKNISTKPNQRSIEVDATPAVREEQIDATPALVDEAADAHPELSSKSVEALEIIPIASHPPSYTSDHEEFNEKDTEHGDIGYVGRTTSVVGQIIRAVSPPILLRLFDVWSLFFDSSKEHSGEIFSAVRSPLLFSPKIPPACP